MWELMEKNQSYSTTIGRCDLCIGERINLLEKTVPLQGAFTIFKMYAIDKNIYYET